MRQLNKLVFVVLLLCNLPVHAKTTDQDQPINIEADSVEIREKQGISIYKGNVKITKGSLLIKGDLIHIHSNKEGLEKILVEGRPATFKQLNDFNEEVSAKSLKMTYKTKTGILELNKEAVLIQSKNKFTSDHIIYNTQKDIVQAGDEQQKSSTKKPARVTITIHPEKDNQQKNNNP